MELPLNIPFRVFCVFCGFILSAGAEAAQRGVLSQLTVSSASLGGPRRIQVYLPPSYLEQTNRRFPVLYLLDGQNVFSSAGPYAAFGWGNWGLDKTVDELSQAGRMQEIIMVAVDNSTNRLHEYSGELGSADGATNKTPFVQYADFLRHELKPKIDREYRTVTDASHTATMGSSLGGLCSLALAWNYPETFGQAACLSTSFQVGHTNFLNAILKEYRGPPKPIRIYLDSGVTDFMGGDDGGSLTREAVEQLRRIVGGTNLEYYVDAKPMTPAELEKTGLRRDKWAEAQKSQHNEFYWRQRAWRPLTFLFPPDANETPKSR